MQYVRCVPMWLSLFVNSIGFCATASKSSEKQWLPFLRGNRRGLGHRGQSSNGTRIYRLIEAPGLTCVLMAFVTSFANAASPDLDFNRDIRPILANSCFYCHGQDGNKRQGDLRLDLREPAVKAGAIVPNDAAASSLIKRILSDDPEQLMPPPKSNRRLSPEQKKLLERWISEGAVYQSHWAFVTPIFIAMAAI